jgi:uncharacterized cupin superfamily protein
MLRFNVLTDAMDDGSDRDGFRWRGARGIGDRLGADAIGASVYELPDGELMFPYHYHHGIEEWLYVLAGSPTVRTPNGVRELDPGTLVRFPSGPAGAHAVRGPGRVVMFSANREPSISVYPDSGKVGTRPGSDLGIDLTFAEPTRSITGRASERSGREPGRNRARPGARP